METKTILSFALYAWAVVPIPIGINSNKAETIRGLNEIPLMMALTNLMI
jgi:hypothetical protein